MEEFATMSNGNGLMTADGADQTLAVHYLSRGAMYSMPSGG